MKTTQEELLEVLTKLVTIDKFYSAQDIKNAFIQHLGSSPDWLTLDWIGWRMRRRFKCESRKDPPTGTHSYRLTPQLITKLKMAHGDER